jgi:hypothetical protein
MRASRLRRRRTLVAALGWLALASAHAIQASVPPPRVAPPSDVRRTAVFGIIATDSAERPVFVRTDSVPNVEGQAYGWFIGVAESRRPVRWIETITLPAPAPSWGGEASSLPPNVSVSADRRSAVLQGEAVPEYGVIYDFWVVAPGDPDGPYTIEVKIEGGREERFHFTLVPSGSSRESNRDAPGGAGRGAQDLRGRAKTTVGPRS